MAKALACLIFLLVILSNHAQGRHLTAGKSTNVAKTSYGNVVSSSPTDIGSRRRYRLEEGYVDSFRPTTPGHSPGIGHSKHD
ncbi:UNVERIFIED_CONTAM: Precursor of CEP3 [Sesamum indicum]